MSSDPDEPPPWVGGGHLDKEKGTELEVSPPGPPGPPGPVSLFSRVACTKHNCLLFPPLLKGGLRSSPLDVAGALCGTITFGRRPRRAQKVLLGVGRERGGEQPPQNTDRFSVGQHPLWSQGTPFPPQIEHAPTLTKQCRGALGEAALPSKTTFYARRTWRPHWPRTPRGAQAGGRGSEGE